MAAEGVHDLPVGRHFTVDGRGVGLRATWRLDRGFVNLSLWRGDSCVETFHLTPAAAADLITFLARGLADAAGIATMATVRAIDDRGESGRRQRVASTLTAKGLVLRARLAGALVAAASRIDPS
ncbi:hypothetical protein BH24ACT3_BH24ACT3_12640 [soil metagenome]